jgi:5,10-methylenetetrahydromethanopterin reductase
LKKLGITFYSVLNVPVGDILEIARTAETNNLGYIAIGESFYRDGFALASAIAENTNRIRLGTSVMPIYTRTPFQLAMGAATLHEISGGRLAFLGLGIGYRKRTEDYFGIKQSDRIERMREYVEIIRKLLSGKDTSYHGNIFDFKGFPRLSGKPLEIPIYFGSSSPKMLGLAGQIADGVILNSLSTPLYVKYAKERISAGAEEFGRKPSAIEIGHSIIYSVAPDFEEAMHAAKEDILFYLSYPELDPVVEKSPFAPEVLRIRALYEKGRKEEAKSLITEEMLDTFAVYGNEKECKTRLERFLRSRGVTLPIIRVAAKPSEKNTTKSIFVRAITSLGS